MSNNSLSGWKKATASLSLKMFDTFPFHLPFFFHFLFASSASVGYHLLFSDRLKCLQNPQMGGRGSNGSAYPPPPKFHKSIVCHDRPHSNFMTIEKWLWPTKEASGQLENPWLVQAGIVNSGLWPCAFVSWMKRTSAVHHRHELLTVTCENWLGCESATFTEECSGWIGGTVDASQPHMAPFLHHGGICLHVRFLS